MFSIKALYIFCFSLSLQANSENYLQNKIIRSLNTHHTNPQRVLLGIKGESALVYESTDSGKNWKPLNNHKSLNKTAKDVQAVAYTSKTILAGTWKHGLFISYDKGNSFQSNKNLPSNDIRDLKSVRKRPQIVFAATAKQGLFKSLNSGKTWRKLKAPSEFFWSLDVSDDGKIITACSLVGNVYLSKNSGLTWKVILKVDSPFFAKINPLNKRQIIVNSNSQGSFLTKNRGKKWKKINLPDKFNTATSSAFLTKDELAIGTQKNGVIILNLKSNQTSQIFDKQPIIHLRKNKTSLLVGTWGKGFLTHKL